MLPEILKYIHMLEAEILTQKARSKADNRNPAQGEV